MSTGPVIALSGPRCCGKSTIADHLVTQHGYTRIAFADALREIAGVSDKELVNDRIYLANLGEKMRQLMPDFLLEVARAKALAIDGPVVIEDLRFPSEVELCRQLNATMIRLEIPEATQLERLEERDGKVGEEASELLACLDETLLDGVSDWSLKIDAVGDFKKLATTLHEIAVKNISELEDSIVCSADAKPSEVVA